MVICLFQSICADIDTESVAIRGHTLRHSHLLRQDHHFSNDRQSSCPSATHQPHGYCHGFLNESIKSCFYVTRALTSTEIPPQEQKDMWCSQSSLDSQMYRLRGQTTEESSRDQDYDVRSPWLALILLYAISWSHYRHPRSLTLCRCRWKNLSSDDGELQAVW